MPEDLLFVISLQGINSYALNFHQATGCNKRMCLIVIPDQNTSIVTTICLVTWLIQNEGWSHVLQQC